MSFVFQDHSIITHPGLYRDEGTGLRFPRKRMIVWETYRVDMDTYGLNATRWRRTSLLLHCLMAGIVATVSPLAALLFIVHPLCTMGWSYVAGRSGVLSALMQAACGLLAIGNYPVLAFVVALVALRWLKEDSVIFLPMVAILWLM